MANLYTVKSVDEALSPLQSYGGNDAYLQALSQQLYNTAGRTVENTNNPFAGITSKAKSIENALGTTGATVVGQVNQLIQNKKTDDMIADNKAKLNSIAQKYGYQSYNDALNNSDATSAPEMWSELQAQANANAETANQNASDYKDYIQNSYVGQKTNQDSGKFLGSAINTLSTAFDIMAPGAGIAANSIQGGLEGVADELEQNGLEGFDWQNAGQRALTGATTGAVVGALNKGLNNKIASNNGNLFKGSNVLTRGANSINNWANKATGGLANTAARGALSGAVGGATGAGLNSALSGQDLSAGIQNTLTGALQGAEQGAVMGTAMGIGNKVANKIPAINNMNQTLQQAGDDFNARKAQDGFGNALKETWDESPTKTALGNTADFLREKLPIGNSVSDVASQSPKITNVDDAANDLINLYKNGASWNDVQDVAGAYGLKNGINADEALAKAYSTLFANNASADNTGATKTTTPADVEPTIRAYQNGEITAEQAVEKYNNGQLSEYALNKVWDAADDNTRDVISNLLEQSQRWQASLPENKNLLQEQISQDVTAQRQAMGKGDIETANALGKRINENRAKLNSNAIENSESTATSPETELYRTLTQAQDGPVATKNTQTSAIEEPLLTSKEYGYKQKAAQALLDQYGTVDVPMSRATYPLDTVQKVADAGFTKPQEVESAIRAITGTSGKVNKLTQNVIQNAGEVDTTTKFIGSDGREMDFNDYLKDVAEGVGLGKFGETGTQANDIIYQVQNKMNKLSSRRNGSLTGTDAAEDVFDVVRDLEALAAGYRGKDGSSYRRQNVTKADGAKAELLENVAQQLKDRVFDASDVSKVVTKEAIADLKSIAPNNQKWAKYVDENIATAKNGQDLRTAQLPFVRMSKIIDNTAATSGTVGSTIARRFKNGVSRNGLIGAAIETVANSPAARKMEYEYYTKQAGNEAAKRLAGNASVDTQNTKTAMGSGATSTTTQETGDITSYDPSREFYNAIGRVTGINEDKDTTNYTNEKELWTNAQNEAAQSLENLAQNYATANANNSAASEASTIMNRLAQAINLAISDGDLTSASELYDAYKMYNTLYGSEESSSDKLTGTQQRANAAMTELENIASMTPDVGYALSDIPLIGDIATLGGNAYEEAANSLAQQIGYMQSGANIKEEELEQIKKSYVPQPWDSEETRARKLENARRIIEQYQNGYMTSTDLQ